MDFSKSDLSVLYQLYHRFELLKECDPPIHSSKPTYKKNPSNTIPVTPKENYCFTLQHGMDSRPVEEIDLVRFSLPRGKSCPQLNMTIGRTS
jgi:hypothetical protein